MMRHLCMAKCYRAASRRKQRKHMVLTCFNRIPVFFSIVSDTKLVHLVFNRIP